MWVPTILSLPLTWCSPAETTEGEVRCPAAGKSGDPALSVPVLLRFAYLVVLRVFGWLALLARLLPRGQLGQLRLIVYDLDPAITAAIPTASSPASG